MSSIPITGFLITFKIPKNKRGLLEVQDPDHIKGILYGESECNYKIHPFGYVSEKWVTITHMGELVDTDTQHYREVLNGYVGVEEKNV